MPIRQPHHHDFRFGGFDYWTASLGESVEGEGVEYVTKTYVCSICNQSRTVTERPALASLVEAEEG